MNVSAFRGVRVCLYAYTQRNGFIACERARVGVCVGKTIRQCFDSHVTRRESVSGDPAMRTPDYPSMQNPYV